MGGDSQTQIVLQMLARLLLYGQTPPEIIGAARWKLGEGGFGTWTDGGPGTVGLEGGVPALWPAGLERRGHVVTVDGPRSSDYGHAQMIERRLDGTLAGAHDPRALTGGTATW